MWKNVTKLISPFSKANNALVQSESCLRQQIRTTFILKRKREPNLNKKGCPAKSMRARHYIYELVKDTSMIKQPDLEVLLTNFVEGVGIKGEIVTVRPNFAYNNLLLPGLAVYATPENVQKFKGFEKKLDDQHSSSTAEITTNILSRLTLSVIMNNETPWTLKPWHVSASFRKCSYIVPEETITLPSKPIIGPNPEIQNKTFFITVTINNLEKARVKCRIHHWATNITDRLPHEHEFWKKEDEFIFPEDVP